METDPPLPVTSRKRRRSCKPKPGPSASRRRLLPDFDSVAAAGPCLASSSGASDFDGSFLRASARLVAAVRAGSTGRRLTSRARCSWSARSTWSLSARDLLAAGEAIRCLPLPKSICCLHWLKPDARMSSSTCILVSIDGENRWAVPELFEASSREKAKGL